MVSRLSVRRLTVRGRGRALMPLAAPGPSERLRLSWWRGVVLLLQHVHTIYIYIYIFIYVIYIYICTHNTNNATNNNKPSESLSWRELGRGCATMRVHGGIHA